MKALTVLALLPALGCSAPSPREQVLATLERAIAAASDGDLAGIFEHVSDAYADEAGNDRASLLAIVGLELRGRERIYLFTRTTEPAFPRKDVAEATVRIAAASTPIDGLRDLDGIDADLFQVDLVLVREGHAWRVIRARRRPASLADFLR